MGGVGMDMGENVCLGMGENGLSSRTGSPSLDSMDDSLSGDGPCSPEAAERPHPPLYFISSGDTSLAELTGAARTGVVVDSTSPACPESTALWWGHAGAAPAVASLQAQISGEQIQSKSPMAP